MGPGRRALRETLCGGALQGPLHATLRKAKALPAFATQTGQPCTACHIGGLGPQLAPLGTAFKIGG